MENPVVSFNMPMLKCKHVHMKDETAVLNKIRKLIEGGAKKLQIVTDFDFTLTKQHENGTRIPSSVVMFLRSKQLPDSCKKKDDELRQKYKKIEIDPNTSISAKIDAMNQWYAETHENLQGHKFDHKEIDEVAQSYCHSLRDGTEDLFGKMRELDVPILVLSAGVGDIIEAVLRCKEILSENVKIVSNFLKFDSGTLDGFRNSDRMIHPFNKNNHTVDNDYFKILRDRTNVILMGDSLGDASMASEENGTQNVLRIGFLYNEEESLSQFKEAFDIVLVDDQTMNVVLEIISLIF